MLPTTRTSAETRRGMASAGKRTRTACPAPTRLPPPVAAATPPAAREVPGEVPSPSHVPGAVLSPPPGYTPWPVRSLGGAAALHSSCRHGCSTDAGTMPRQTGGPSTAASGHAPSAPEQTRRWCHVSSPRARTRGLASHVASSRATTASRGRLRAVGPPPAAAADGEYSAAGVVSELAPAKSAPPLLPCTESSRMRAAATAAIERKRTDGPKGRVPEARGRLLEFPAPPPLLSFAGARG